MKTNYWAPVFVWLCFIFILSSFQLKGPDLIWFDVSGFTQHVVEYGVLGFLVIRAIGSSHNLPTMWAVVAVFLFSLAYGVTDEIHQFFVPGRMFSMMDIVADGVGGFAGALAHAGVYSPVKTRFWKKSEIGEGV